VYTWNDSVPTHCPTNTSHEISSTTISIIDSVDNKTVNVIQEAKPTGGNYRVRSGRMNITQTGLTTQELTFPYLISVLTITPYSTTANNDDELSVIVTPNTPIGVLTTNADTPDTVLNVNSTVIDNIMVGYYVYIIKNNTQIEVGECIDIDKVNNTITLDTPINELFTAGDYVGINIYLMRNFELYGDTAYELARKTIGSSSVETNLIVRIVYNNKTNDNKTLRYIYEHLY
jgi:hypothetical protein